MAIGIVVNSHTLTPETFNSKVDMVMAEVNLGTYATGGIAVAYTDVNTAMGTYDTANKTKSMRLSSITHVQCASEDATGWTIAWDKSAEKIKAWSTPGTEATAIDLSAKTFQVIFFGERAA
jgi:hypothetical protein